MADPAGWFTYMLRCRDNTFYTGITTDPESRLQAHNHGRSGARYTRGRRPVSLVYMEAFPSRAAAAKREFQLKRLPRATKELLIAAAGETGKPPPDSGPGECPEP